MTEPTARESVYDAVWHVINIALAFAKGESTEYPPAEALIARLETAEAERDRAQAWIRARAVRLFGTHPWTECVECGGLGDALKREQPQHAPDCYVAELLEGHDDA